MSFNSYHRWLYLRTVMLLITEGYRNWKEAEQDVTSQRKTEQSKYYCLNFEHRPGNFSVLTLFNPTDCV